MSDNDYHARLSAHLTTLLSTHLDALATAGPGSMVTDLEALKARDREHARAWMTEGYARYVGGVKDGFELHPEERGRKRRYTEGAGLLERRGRLLALGGIAEGSAVSDEEEERREKRQRIDRGREPTQTTSARRTVSAGPKTPDTPNAPTPDEPRLPQTTPGLAFVPPPTQMTHPSPRAFTLQQPPPPRRPFRRPLQPKTAAQALEESSTSQASVVLASQFLVPRVEEHDEVPLDAVKAIGTSLSASSALSAFVHLQQPQHQSQQQHHAPIPCAASPSVGSLTSASLGCARAAMLTPCVVGSQTETGTPAGKAVEVRTEEGRVHPEPTIHVEPTIFEEPATSDAPENVPEPIPASGSGARSDAGKAEEEDIWACFMELGEMGTPIGSGTISRERDIRTS